MVRLLSARYQGCAVAAMFVIPGASVKNSDDRRVVLNRMTKSVIEREFELPPVRVVVHVYAKDGDPTPSQIPTFL